MKKVVLIERYMKKTWITTACLLFATVAIGQVPELSPTPQSCVLGKDKYQKPSIFLFKGLNETDTVNQRFAENLLPKQKEQGKYWKLIVGEAGDRSVRSVRKRVPQQSEGYYLRVRDHEIIVAGRDERGTFYGLQTLKQLLQQPSIPELEITDYPDVPFRGIVEGYYGKPMDFETHLRMFGYYGANKMNISPTISSASVLTMEMSDKNLDALIADMDKGILVTGFNGGNCNSTSGDFSYGVEGFLIEGGKLTQPISEMNVTGNMIKLWNQLIEVGNDPRLSSSWQIPSLCFEGIDFSGL